MTHVSVLLLEDDDDLRQVFSEFLQEQLPQLPEWQLTVVGAASHTEGKARIEEAERKERPFDLILLDYLMPDGRIEDLVRWIRIDKRLTAPIILCTAAQDGKIDLLLKLHIFQGFIRKPFNMEDLAEKIRRAIEDTAPLLPAP
jgi:CheY-like chemotaxis protein